VSRYFRFYKYFALLSISRTLTRLNRGEEIVKRDELRLRLCCLEKEVDTHAGVVQRYEALILSLQEEKEALRNSTGNDPILSQRLDSDLLYELLKSG
jgi:hypothetical protein